jgi:hypothetical protein
MPWGRLTTWRSRTNILPDAPDGLCFLALNVNYAITYKPTTNLKNALSLFCSPESFSSALDIRVFFVAGY